MHVEQWPINRGPVTLPQWPQITVGQWPIVHGPVSLPLTEGNWGTNILLAIFVQSGTKTDVIKCKWLSDPHLFRGAVIFALYFQDDSYVNKTSEIALFLTNGTRRKHPCSLDAFKFFLSSKTVNLTLHHVFSTDGFEHAGCIMRPGTSDLWCTEWA